MQRKFNRELSLHLYNQIKAKPSHCFSNSVKALALVPKAEYVEGYTVSPSVSEPYLHAWLELDGNIIDPSLPNGDREYFPAGRRTMAEYSKIVKEIENLKRRGPTPLTDEAKKNLPKLVQEDAMNPNYHNILVKKMRLNNTNPEFNSAYKQAIVHKKEHN